MSESAAREVIYGINPVRELLFFRPSLLEKVIVSQGRTAGPLAEIAALAAQKGVPFLVSDKRELERLSGGGVHQGVVGLCRPFRYADLDQVIANRHPCLKYDLVVLLDGVTDPQNLGAIMRTAHCLGANGLVIAEHRAASVTPAAVKASAGAAYLLPTARVVNLVGTVGYLKERGFWIYGADAAAATVMGEVRYDGPCGLVMGSEGKGIRPLVKKNCDFLISIPLRGRVASLNVSVATGIILSEILRRWGE